MGFNSGFKGLSSSIVEENRITLIHATELIKRLPLTLSEPNPILKGPPKTAKPLHEKMQANRKKK
jgi:hypothetical protein